LFKEGKSVFVSLIFSVFRSEYSREEVRYVIFCPFKIDEPGFHATQFFKPIVLTLSQQLEFLEFLGLQ
jgi:hypothetical protein